MPTNRKIFRSFKVAHNTFRLESWDLTGEKKVKLYICESYSGNGGIAPLILTFSTRWR